MGLHPHALRLRLAHQLDGMGLRRSDLPDPLRLGTGSLNGLASEGVVKKNFNYEVELIYIYPTNP